MASKILVDELAPQSHATDVTITTGKKVAGANTQFKITGGSADDFLKTDGAGALSWGTPSGGKILQVLEDNLNTTVSTTSTSYVASGLSIAITPAATSSKILLTLSGGTWANGSDGYQGYVTFYVDGSEVGDTGPYEEKDENHNGNAFVGHSATCLHSPSTTSAVTYTVYYKTESGSTTYFNRASARTVFTVMEIGA